MASKYSRILSRVNRLEPGKSTKIKPLEGESGDTLSNRLSSVFFKAVATGQLELPGGYRISKKVNPDDTVTVRLVPKK